MPQQTFYLYMWEAMADNSYSRTIIDSRSYHVFDGVGRVSRCGDLDGDGVEELVWATPREAYLYKATGDNQFQQVWYWDCDHGDLETVITNIYDMNGDGYNELVVGGSRKTSIFEVEGIKVVWPNGGENLTPGQGGACLIRWRTFNPPRCDSVSLFLRTDSTWRLDTIVTGLPAGDTVYPWIVPPGPHDSCRIVAIAYGPSWLYDESDATFKILPGGVAEATPAIPRRWSLSVSPNPAAERTLVSYDVPVVSEVRLGLYDAAGRLVAVLADGERMPGCYTAQVGRALPAGVYLARLESAAYSATRKLVVQH